MLKKRLIQIFWITAGIATIVLLGAAMQQKNKNKCTNIIIEIAGIEEHVFIDEKDVLNILNSNGKLIGKEVANINLRKLENILDKNPWVKNAELFFNNQKELIVNIKEREPIARVFTVQGSSFYVDTAANILPLSDKFSARVPVFTGFSTDKVQTYADSLLMKDVIKISKIIYADSFWNAQVAQINILPNASFEMIPVLGNQTVTIGNAEDVEKKFSRLFAFYKSVWLQNGINKYEQINIEYSNQVIGIKKGVIPTTTEDSIVSKENKIPNTITLTTENKQPKAILKKQ